MVPDRKCTLRICLYGKSSALFKLTPMSCETEPQQYICGLKKPFHFSHGPTIQTTIYFKSNGNTEANLTNVFGIWLMHFVNVSVPSWKTWGWAHNIHHVCYSHINSFTALWVQIPALCNTATLSIDSWWYFYTDVFWHYVNHQWKISQHFSLFGDFTDSRLRKEQERSITKVWVVWRVSFCTNILASVLPGIVCTYQIRFLCPNSPESSKQIKQITSKIKLF